MSTIEVVNHITLDGVMQSPAGADEDPRGGFEHGGWTVPYLDDVQTEYMSERMSSRGDGALLFGRWTYNKMHSAWTQQPEDNPIRQVLENSRKYVASRSEDPVEWQNSELLHGDAAETVAELKGREDRNFVILGSGELIQALLPHGLIDSWLLTIYPLVLGSGRRMFGDDGALATPTPTGVLICRYEAA